MTFISKCDVFSCSKQQSTTKTSRFDIFHCFVLAGLQVEGIHRKDGQHSVVSRLLEQFTAGLIAMFLQISLIINLLFNIQ